MGKGLAVLAASLLAGVAAIVATGTTTASVAAPRDGLIVFQVPGKVGEYDLWTTRPNGKSLRRLTTAPRDRADYSPTWTPDGSRVVFERRMLTGTPEEDLYIVSAAGGKPTQLTDCRDDCWSDGEPDVSSDGTQIVFGRATGPRSAAFPDRVVMTVMNMDGTGMRQISRPPLGFEDHSPSFAPGGRTVVFRRENSSTMAAQLIVVDVKTGVERVVYTFPPWAPGGGSPMFSPDGKRILFGYWCGYGDACPSSAFQRRNSRLATIRPDGTGLEVLEIALRADSAGWSPSGKQIAFRCNDANFGKWSLCTSRPDGSRLKRFRLPWRLESVHPSWGTHF